MLHLFWRKNRDHRGIRHSDYAPIFKRDYELPLEAWTFLVKHRAGFECENCGASNKEKELHAHHIRRPGDGGKNTLRNGKALCITCHGETRVVSVPRKTWFQKLVIKIMGKRRAVKFHQEVKREIEDLQEQRGK